MHIQEGDIRAYLDRELEPGKGCHVGITPGRMPTLPGKISRQSKAGNSFYPMCLRA